MSRFYFEYTVAGETKYLEIKNAEELTPVRTETGTSATAVNGEQENLYFRTEKTLVIRTRGVKECEMARWIEFIDATKCGSFFVHTSGRLSWDGWDGAEVTRTLDKTKPQRDGKDLWLFDLELRQHA